jgi:hypothetical protein
VASRYWELRNRNPKTVTPLWIFWTMRELDNPGRGKKGRFRCCPTHQGPILSNLSRLQKIEEWGKPHEPQSIAGFRRRSKKRAEERKQNHFYLAPRAVTRSSDWSLRGPFFHWPQIRCGTYRLFPVDAEPHKRLPNPSWHSGFGPRVDSAPSSSPRTLQ